MLFKDDRLQKTSFFIQIVLCCFPKFKIMKNSFCDKLQQYQPSRSEAEDLYSLYIVGCVLNVFLSYTTIMLNTATIYAIRKTSSLPQPLKTLLLSLAVSDLGVGLLCQPFFISLLVKWLKQNNQDSCVVYTTFAGFFGGFSFASFFGVMFLSIDRFLAIYLHLRYQELVTHKRVVKMVMSLWVFSAFLSLSMLWVPTNIIFMVFAIVEFACLAITTFISYKIYVAVRRHRNQIQSLQVQQVDQNGAMANAVSISKSSLGTVYVYLVFLLCFLPHICSDAVMAILGISTTLKRLSVFTMTIAFLNSSLNPVIYCWKMRHIRRAMMDILRNILPRYN